MERGQFTLRLPGLGFFFHHLLLVGLEEVSESGTLGNLREREGGGEGGGLRSPGTLILVGGEPGQTPWIPGRQKTKLVCP